MDVIRLLIIDDHSLFREGLSRYLQTTRGLRVVGECATIQEALAAFSSTPADVVLLDYDLGEGQGSNLLLELKRRQPDARVLFVTAGMPDSVAHSVLKSGASGIFFKRGSLDQLLTAIHHVANGQLWLDEETARMLMGIRSSPGPIAPTPRPLTARQREVLRGILDGLTNKEIAVGLDVSESSVKAVIQELFLKAGVRTRSQLVRIAVERHSSDWLGRLSDPS